LLRYHIFPFFNMAAGTHNQQCLQVNPSQVNPLPTITEFEERKICFHVNSALTKFEGETFTWWPS